VSETAGCSQEVRVTLAWCSVWQGFLTGVRWCFCSEHVHGLLCSLPQLHALSWYSALFNSPLTAEKQLTPTVSAKGRLARGKSSFKKKKKKNLKSRKAIGKGW